MAPFSRRSPKSQSRELPYAVFELASSLMPQLLSIFKRCDLSPSELFLLTHIRHAGKDYRDELKALPKTELRDILTNAFRQSAGQVTKDIQELMSRDLLDEKVVRKERKHAMFGFSEGSNKVYVLTQAGSDKIDEFISLINELFGQLAGKMPSPAFKALALGLKVFAAKAVTRIDSSAL